MFSYTQRRDRKEAAVVKRLIDGYVTGWSTDAERRRFREYARRKVRALRQEKPDIDEEILKRRVYSDWERERDFFTPTSPSPSLSPGKMRLLEAAGSVVLAALAYWVAQSHMGEVAESLAAAWCNFVRGFRVGGGGADGEDGEDEEEEEECIKEAARFIEPFLWLAIVAVVVWLVAVR